MLIVFLTTMLVILVLAVIGFIFVDQLETWAVTPWLIGFAGLCLGIGPACVVWQAARYKGMSMTGKMSWPLLGLLLLTSPAWAATTTRCLTYEERSLGRLQTLCDDGTRATHTYNKTLSRWESTITPPPGQTCTRWLNPKTRQWEGRCR